jgi:uncharacterized repeat protein (TIGR02543 family)
MSSEDSYKFTSATLTLPTPARRGYKFDGWYETENFGGSAVTTIPAGSTGDREFYTKWIPLQEVLDTVATLQEALDLLAASAEENGAYIITVKANESIVPNTLSYSVNNVSVTLVGDTAERTVSLGSAGTLFTIGSDVILTLDNNVTLQGR